MVFFLIFRWQGVCKYIPSAKLLKWGSASSCSITVTTYLWQKMKATCDGITQAAIQSTCWCSDPWALSIHSTHRHKVKTIPAMLLKLVPKWSLFLDFDISHMLPSFCFFFLSFAECSRFWFCLPTGHCHGAQAGFKCLQIDFQTVLKHTKWLFGNLLQSCVWKWSPLTLSTTVSTY